MPYNNLLHQGDELTGLRQTGACPFS